MKPPNEVVSYMVGYLQIEKTKPTFEGKISAQEHVDAWKKEIANSKYSNDVKEVLYAALPLVKENLDLQKKQYGAEKANTIVIARKQYDGNDAGGNTRAQIYGGAKYRPFKAEPRVEEANRGGEGADAKEG